jgi:hypothetical protein
VASSFCSQKGQVKVMSGIRFLDAKSTTEAWKEIKEN